MGAHPHKLTQSDKVYIVQTVEAAGKILAGYFGGILTKNHKRSHADYATQADMASEKHISTALKQRFPHFSFLGEETGSVKTKSPYQFVLDPLDGTHTFGLGFPIFSISLALFHDDEVIFSVIHEPITTWTYTAEKGRGATRNGQPIRVNTNSVYENLIVHYTQGWAVKEKFEDEFVTQVRTALRGYERFSSYWSPASEMAHLAAGYADAFLGNQNEVYDFAAGRLLIREAGGKITDLNGSEQTSDRETIFLASNGGPLHDEILRRIRGIITP